MKARSSLVITVQSECLITLMQGLMMRRCHVRGKGLPPTLLVLPTVSAYLLAPASDRTVYVGATKWALHPHGAPPPRRKHMHVGERSFRQFFMFSSEDALAEALFVASSSRVAVCCCELKFESDKFIAAAIKEK